MNAEDWAELREVAGIALRGLASPPYAVWLYGSRASGTENDESDFDFAVATEGRVDDAERRELQQRIAEALEAKGFGWPDIDVVDLQAVPLTLAAQVLETGKILYCSDEVARAFLETRLMSMYASLNEERREVIEAILARGRVYA